jgi:pimeloyl-ACP methyl ester carboxylesterase
MIHPGTGTEIDAALRRFASEASQQSFVTPRYRYRYFLWGNGPPVVFIHGLSDRAKSFVLPMARLADRFTCIGVELADGLGDGAKLGAYRHRHHVEDLIRLLNHLSFENVDLVGSSYGTTVALRALGTYPKRFRRCVLQGGFACRPLHWYERGPARVTRYWPGRIGDVPGRNIVLSRLDGPQFAAVPKAVFQFFLNCFGETPIRALTRRALILDRLDLRPWLADIPHPMLMIGGDSDRIVPRNYEAELEAGLPNVRRIELAHSGHYPQYTHPGPMAEAIREFLLS